MNYKIVSDSSANIHDLDGMNFVSVPLHIIVDNKDFVDDASLNLNDMLNSLTSYDGKSSTSCPSVKEWIDAFGDAEAVFCVTITSNLSGAFGSAKIAASLYESEFPGRKVYLFDSLSTGPEMSLILYKIVELINAGKDTDAIYKEVCEYQKISHLYFTLSSLDNLAKNGRINKVLAKGIGILGIKIVGKASDEGTLQPMDKCRGDKRAYSCLISHMKKCGYAGGKVVISHTNNPEGADEMNELIRSEFGYNNATIMENRGLVSYYAEPGSVMIGFEA